MAKYILNDLNPKTVINANNDKLMAKTSPNQS